MRKLSESQAKGLIPNYWRVRALSAKDILFFGQVNIRGMIQSWRYEANSLVSQIKRVDEKLQFLQGKNATQVKRAASRFEKPDFPRIGRHKDFMAGDPEPLDVASITRKRGATTFNFCGWCKHTGGGSCRYNYYITSTCSFKTDAGQHDDERQFNTPCFLTAAPDAEFDKLRAGLTKQLERLNSAKSATDEKIKTLLELEKLAEKKPAFPDHRPHDWFNEGDPVVCYVGNWSDRCITDEFATAKVILGYRHHDGAVSVCFDQKMHDGEYLEGHGGGYGSARPDVMHAWEYEYMLQHPDFCNVWLKQGTSNHREGYDPNKELSAFARSAMAKSKKTPSSKRPMTPTTKTFHLGDILSVTTGRLVSLRPHMDGVYDILNFMTGDELFTHQLPRANKECKPFLLAQFPELAQAETPKNLARLDELIADAKHRKEPPVEAIKMWLKWMAEPGTCNLKEEYEVSQIPRDAHQLKHPVTELAEMVDDPSKIIIVKTSTDKGGVQ